MSIYTRFATAMCAAAAAVSCIAASAPKASAATVMTKDEIIADMGLGWNLGNTFEATRGTWNKNYDHMTLETSWGNPKVTKQLIQFVHNSGFNTIRIPISWGYHMLGDDYTINEQWMARVHEVVDYAIDEDMYVIINIHHDNTPRTQENVDKGWVTEVDNKFFYPSNEYKAQSLEFVGSVWQQVSEEFKDYDQHLIFETLNEPRLVGDTNEWRFTTSNPQTKVAEAISVLNDLNQKAVDVIRASGGNNTNRLIMCPGYDASLDGAVTPGYKLPTDSSNKTVVAVHAYTPYNFAMNADSGSVSAFNTTMQSELKSLFTSIKSDLLNKGYSVVIGEFGATNKENNDARISWADAYAKQASELGIPIVLWDNNAYPYYNSSTGKMDYAEKYGLVKRSDYTLENADYLAAMTKYYDNSKILSDPDVTLSKTSFEYTGSSITADSYITVKYDGATLTKNTDYTLTYKNNTSAGTATVTVTGKGDYAGSVDKTFKITAKNISSCTSALAYTAITYTSGGINADKYLTVKDGTKTLVKETDYTTSYSGASKVGYESCTLTIKGKGNYTGTITRKLTVKPAKLDKPTLTTKNSAIYVTWKKTTTDGLAYQVIYDKVKDFDTSAKNHTADYHTTTVEDLNTLTKTLSAYTKPGETWYVRVRCFITNTGKVDGTRYGTFSTAVPITVKGNVSAVSIPYASYTYTGSTITPAVTVKDTKGNKLTTSDYTVTYSNNTKVGTATIKVTGKGNYQGTYTRTFVIKPAKNAVSTLTSTKANTFTVTYKAATSGATGYQILYSKDKDFATYHSTSVTNLSTLSKTVSSNVKSGETWYVKVRSYVEINGTRYGNYSDAKPIKIK